MKQFYLKSVFVGLAIIGLASACTVDKSEKVVKVSREKRILFGDLHVHSTNSMDAAINSIPVIGNYRNTPPAQRCDFARFCSQLDFWSINDHPENMPTNLWRETREDIQACNNLEGGYSSNPNMVSFLGWEWTQSAGSPAESWGHKNVILLNDGKNTPARPIAAGVGVTVIDRGIVDLVITTLVSIDPSNEDFYNEMAAIVYNGLDSPTCEFGVDTRELSPDCREVARTPGELYEKLDQWGYAAIVIPHGTAWGSHNPIGSGWKYQLNRTEHDPKYEIMAEIYSGHGNSEEYRDWRAAKVGEDGSLTCEEPTEDFLPCCWQAGEIERGRAPECRSDPQSAACETAVAAARQQFLDAGHLKGYAAGATDPTMWLDCGNCRDCFQPAFLYRPGYSIQAALAMTDFENPEEPFRYHWGLVGSTDTHASGGGAGYKEFRRMSDSFGTSDPSYDAIFNAIAPTLFPEWERQSAYWYSGGLIAVHSEGRDRKAIWDAMKRREVYATSGERMLLWFDLENGPSGEVNMGQMVSQTESPKFRIKAVGAFKQNPGCPEEIVERAGSDFIETSCFGECYNPTDERYLIERLEVVKIEPQISADEDILDLIHDPFLVIDCEPNAEGCEGEFEDNDYATNGRPAVYYVRAIQEATEQFNAENLRCEDDEDGKCAKIKLCIGGYRAADDDCLALDNERAWSSPIYLNP